MITGARTSVPSVALSGPNSRISRLSFDVTEEDLNDYTFNIVPDRDPVPRIDDLSLNYQRIQCTSEANKLFGCHKPILAICEIMHNCGSEGRGFPCICVHEYGYPEPDIIDEAGETFLQACPKPESKKQATESVYVSKELFL